MHNILNNNLYWIESLQNPEAFIFIYEKLLFFSISKGKMKLYSAVDGSLITDFDDKILYS